MTRLYFQREKVCVTLFQFVLDSLLLLVGTRALPRKTCDIIS